jgi:hypothetical protein
LDILGATRRQEELLGRKTALHLFSDELPYRRVALAWLAERKTAEPNLLWQLEPVLGPSEKLLLTDSSRELGWEPGDEVSGLTMGAVWVGPESPLTIERARELSANDLVTWMRYVPATTGIDRGPSAEGLSRVLQQLLSEKTAELIESLSPGISETPYASVLVGLINGVNDGLKVESNRQSVGADSLFRFIDAVLKRAEGGGFQSEEFLDYGASAIKGAVADLLSDQSAWLTPLLSGERIRSILSPALSDPDPTPERETKSKSGEGGMDPPTIGLNSTRGKGFRAMLAMLATTWTSGEDGSEEVAISEVMATHGELAELFLSVVRVEPSPGVISWAGAYLPWLLTRWPKPAEDPMAVLLPTSPELGPRWESVFVTYLVFRPQFLDLGETLLAQYDLAVTRLSSGHEFPYLGEHADRLLIHIMRFAWGQTSPEVWRPLLMRALDAADESSSGSAISTLAYAAAREELELQSGVVLPILRTRLRLSVGKSELGAWANLLLAMNLPLHEAGTYLLDLVSRGAVADVENLLTYLNQEAHQGSEIGARIVSRAARTGLLSSPWAVEDELLRSTIRNYSKQFADEMRVTVDALGESGKFSVEPEALLVYGDRG